MKTYTKAILLPLTTLILSCNQKEVDLEKYINLEIASGKVPGIGLSIIVESDILLSKGYGYADIENQIPFTDSTIMNIASISKTFIGVSMMHAVEKGLIELDDDVNKYLSFKVVNPHRPKKKIMVKHMMGHRSSIIDENKTYTSSYHYGGDAPTNLGEFLKNYLSEGGSYYSKENFLDKDSSSAKIIKQYWHNNKKLQRIHDEFSENSISNYYLPFAIAPNFLINDKIYEKYHIKPGDTDDTKLFTLQTASCLGNCGAAPMAIIGDDTHGTIDPEKTYDILGEYKKEDEVTQETEEVG